MRLATLCAFAALLFATPTSAQDLILTGVVDGDLSGGLPKAVEIYVANDVNDLSDYALGSANNGGGSDGAEFTLPSEAATAGDFLYISTSATEFNTFFGFDPDYIDGSVAINGDDAVELFFDIDGSDTFEAGEVIDVFGEIDTDGSGTTWEYADGWAYRTDETGPDGANFVEDNWSFGLGALDGAATNDEAASPFPIGSYVAGSTSDPVTIAEARETPGETVTIEGTVTRAMGEFVYIQDGTAGMTIRQSEGDFFDDVADGTIAPGIVIEVTGTILGIGNLLQISGDNLESYTLVGMTAVPEPQTVTLAEIAAAPEEFESELLKITGVTIDTEDATFVAETGYAIDDESGETGDTELFVPAAEDTEIDDTEVISPAIVTAVLTQFSSPFTPDQGYRLNVIQTGDVIAQPGPITIAEAREAEADETIIVQGTVTRAMGDFTYFQDDTAALAIFQTEGDFFDDVADGTIAPGVVIEVTGTLFGLGSQLTIFEDDLESYTIVDTVAVPEPQTVTLAEIAATPEEFESELLQVADVTIDTEDATFQADTSYDITDPSDESSEVTLRIDLENNTEVDGTDVVSPALITAVLGQFSFIAPDAGYQLRPILEDDVVAQPGPTPITEARDAGVGETVTIEGTVTRAMGDFTYFQDDTAALTIRQTEGDFFDDVADGAIAPGVVIEVTGTLSEFANLLQINEDDLESYTIVDTVAVPEPQTVTLAEITGNGEDYEAELVEVAGLTVLNTDNTTFLSATSYDISSVDGEGTLRIPNSNDTEIDGTPIPEDPFTATAIVGQFNFTDPATGYQLLPIQEDDIVVTVATDGDPENRFALTGPNPITGPTTLTVTLPQATDVSLVLYDVRGRRVATLAEGRHTADTHEITLDASGLAAGTYVLHLHAGDQTLTRTLTVAR